MAPSPPIGSFQELAHQRLAIRVTCQRCGHVAIVDPGAPGLSHRRLAGQRFRCSQKLASGKPCGGIGLPSIEESRLPNQLGKARRWPGRLAERAHKLDEK